MSLNIYQVIHLSGRNLSDHIAAISVVAISAEVAIAAAINEVLAVDDITLVPEELAANITDNDIFSGSGICVHEAE